MLWSRVDKYMSQTWKIYVTYIISFPCYYNSVFCTPSAQNKYTVKTNFQTNVSHSNLLELVVKFDTLLFLLFQADLQTFQPVVLLQSGGSQRGSLLLQIQHWSLKQSKKHTDVTQQLLNVTHWDALLKQSGHNCLAHEQYCQWRINPVYITMWLFCHFYTTGNFFSKGYRNSLLSSLLIAHCYFLIVVLILQK